MRIVLDTNVIVSALWSRNNKPALILNCILSKRLTPCYDYRIINEYENVLHRPKFSFQEWEISSLIDFITKTGLSVVPEPLPEIPFTDESDRKFLEVARFCCAYLINGNIRHYPYPQDSCIITVTDFYNQFLWDRELD